MGVVLEERGIGADLAASRVVIRVAIALVVGLALLGAGPPVAALALATASLGPTVARRILARRRADRRDTQLPEFLERLASSMRAGNALGSAVVATARSTPDPLGHELARVADEVEHGAGLVAALARWGGRPEAGPQVALTAAALGLAAACGGEVARSVDRVATTLRERRELRHEVHALATQARASAAVLAAIPLGFTALVASVDRAAVSFLVTSPIGLLCLSGGLFLEAVGAGWMARIVRSAS